MKWAGREAFAKAGGRVAGKAVEKDSAWDDSSADTLESGRVELKEMKRAEGKGHSKGVVQTVVSKVVSKV